MDSRITRIRKLSDCYTINDLRELAYRRLPKAVFHSMEGAGFSELTAERSISAFDDIKLVHKGMIDVSRIDTSINLLGQELQFPLYCGPTGMTRLYHKDGELAVARACAATGAFYGVSMVSAFTHEQIAAETAGPKILQIYVFRDRDLTMSLVENAKKTGYQALCVTIDATLPGRRYRDHRTGLIVPPKLTLGSLFDFAKHPGWVYNHFSSEKMTMASLAAHIGEEAAADPASSMQFMGSQLDPSVTWEDAQPFVEAWGGPFAIKGVMHPDDARRAIDIGASAIIVSTHGGRQFDGGATPIETLPGIVEAVDGRAEVILDGGIRSGVHVLKALALGADAVSFGRPYIYGLSCGGEKGVAKALDILTGEFRSSMALMGAQNISQIGRDFVLE